MNSLNSEYLFYQTKKALNLVHRAQGIRIWDKSGKKYIDGCSGAIVCNIGYHLLRAVQVRKNQMQQKTQTGICTNHFIN